MATSKNTSNTNNTTKKTHLEGEIERAREDGAWKRVIELAEQLKPGAPTLCSFLLGEAKLEEFLEEHPPKISNVSLALTGLKQAAEYLMETLDDDVRHIGVQLDSYILLGKINYAQGKYSEAMKHYERAQLDNLEEKKLPPRSLKIIAEAFAIKANCREHMPSSSQSRNERDCEIIQCTELSADLTILYLQLLDSNSSNLSPSSSSINKYHKLGYILESNLFKGPLMNLRAKYVDKAIHRFRSMLLAKETDSTIGIRLSICKQLSEILLQKVSDSSYSKPDLDAFRQSTTLNERYWKPQKHEEVNNPYVPTTRTDEIILLLLIGECMASKEAVLSQNTDCYESRKRSYNNATNIYDLMTVTMARRGCFHLLSEMLERSMKFSSGESHTWTQFAMSLAAEGKYFRALLLYRQIADVSQAEVGPTLVIAKLCYERLGLHEEGLKWSQKALELDSSGNYKARCCIYIGIGHLMISYNFESRSIQKEHQEKSRQYFQESIAHDSNDHLAEFYLAYNYSLNNDVSKALEHVSKALSLMPDHLASLHLMILLLSTSEDRLSVSLDLLMKTLEDYPDSLALLTLRVRLEEVIHTPAQALLTTKMLLTRWQKAYLESQHLVHSNPLNKMLRTSSTVFDYMTSEDSVSLRTTSITASHVEKTLSEVASSMSQETIVTGKNHSFAGQAKIWLLSAELNLKLGNKEEAELCVMEARNISPLSHHLMVVRGLIFEEMGDLTSAQQCFENALGINPSYVNCLYYLSKVYYAQRRFRLAEQSVKMALRYEPSKYELWSLFGDITEALAHESLSNQNDKDNVSNENQKEDYLEERYKLLNRASKYYSVALSVERTAPIMPYNSIPLVFE